MKTSIDRSSAATLILGLGLCLPAYSSRVVAADEPQTCHAECAILSKIPYVQRLFKCEIATDKCEPIGVDFDIEAPCESPCSQKANCCGQPIDQSTSKMAMAVCRGLVEAAEQACVDAAERERELIVSLLELTQEAAAATATLEAWKESAANEAMLRQELTEARIGNAQLVAKLRMSEEKHALAAELHKAQMEIAALKVELAETKLAARDAQVRQPKVAESHKAAPR